MLSSQTNMAFIGQWSKPFPSIPDHDIYYSGYKVSLNIFSFTSKPLNRLLKTIFPSTLIKGSPRGISWQHGCHSKSVFTPRPKLVSFTSHQNDFIEAYIFSELSFNLWEEPNTAATWTQSTHAYTADMVAVRAIHCSSYMVPVKDTHI